MPAYSLALCLDAPMQSWGVRSRGTVRDTGTEPSKSGVVGLLGAALGMRRDDHEQTARLAQLRMGVRVDRDGILERDFHTAQNVPTTTGSGHRTVVSHRYYLADALFLVVLEDHDADLLGKLFEALRRPRWPLFLGRRAFVPARPLVSSGTGHEPGSRCGPSEQPLETVLASHPWLENRPDLRHGRRTRGVPADLRIVVDATPGDARSELRYDLPVSFEKAARQFGPRTVRTGRVPLTDSMLEEGEGLCT